MQKLYSATTYFIIGYTIITAIITSLYFLPGAVRASLGAVLAAIIFVDMCYRYFKKCLPVDETVKLKSVIMVMAYWAVLSISLDILIMVVALPIIANGDVNWIFFSQQPTMYWFQFPMFFVFGLVAQAIYNRVVTITTTEVDHI